MPNDSSWPESDSAEEKLESHYAQANVQVLKS